MTERQRELAFWLGILLLLCFALYLLSAILLPFLASIVLAYLLHPAVDRLVRLGLRRSLASVLVLIAFLLVVVLLLVLLVPLIETQIADFMRRAPALIDLAREQFERMMRFAREQLAPEDVTKLRDLLGSRMTDLVAWVAGLAEGMLTSGIALANLASLVVITPIVTFFMLRDWGAMIALIAGWVPRHHATTIHQQARIIDRTLAGFVRGQVLVCLMLGAYYAITLTVAGLDFGIVIGLIIGLIAFIPVVGATLGFVLSIGLAILQFDHWSSVAIIAAIFAVGQTVEGNILAPKLVGERVNLHPVWVIFALLAFGRLFGLIGVLLAVPAAAVIGVLVRFALRRYLESPFYDGGNRARRGNTAPEP